MTLIMVTLWLVAVGCAPLVSSPTGKVKKRTQHFSSALAIPDYSLAVGHCTKTAVWKKLDGTVLPIGEFFRGLNDVKNKRDFAIKVTGSKVISATKIVIACDMRQQVQIGIPKLFPPKGVGGRLSIDLRGLGLDVLIGRAAGGLHIVIVRIVITITCS